MTQYRDSYVESLLLEVRHYQYENGRRYHGYKEGSEPDLFTLMLHLQTFPLTLTGADA
jgi:hypothetical protein